MMTAAAPIFDRLVYVQRLRSAGIDEQQAIAQADALDGAFRESVVTRADVGEVKADIRQIDDRIDVLEANIKVDIRQIDHRIDVLEANIKADIRQIDHRIDVLEANVKADIASVTGELAAAIQRQTVWLGGTMIALLAIGVTLANTL